VDTKLGINKVDHILCLGFDVAGVNAAKLQASCTCMGSTFAWFLGNGAYIWEPGQCHSDNAKGRQH